MKAGMQKVRYEIGAHVRIKTPGVNGTVISVDSEPTMMGEYWHTIEVTRGHERREPGCNLELVPRPITN